MHIPEGFIIGKFSSEDKNRFLCTVEIDGAKETCYIASSCRLDNFINLRKKEVLLKHTVTPNASTRYAVCAVRHKFSYILLNTSLANKAIENTMASRKLASFGRRSDFKKEYTIQDYKTDFYIPSSKTIIEVKSVISTEVVAVFPTVFSERTITQLSAIEKLLQSGYKAHFVIVSLNPYVKEIEILKNTECCETLLRCIDRGLEIDAFTCKLLNDGNVYIHKKIPWNFS